MNFTTFQNYLLIINVIGLILYLINMLLYNFTIDAQIDLLVTITCFLGGSIGILIPVLIFRRKINKENEPIIMSTVFLYSIIPIQIVLYLIIKNGVLSGQLNKLFNFLNNNIIFIYYLLIINIITFIVYGLDKLFAVKQRKRIRISVLLELAFIGGEFGGLLAMKLFNHKTNKDYFSIGLPLIMIMHIVIFFYIIFIR